MNAPDIFLYIAIFVLNLPVCYIWYKVLFEDIDEFGEAIAFWFTPDFYSAVQGEYWADRMASFKFGIWLALCIGSGYLEFRYIGIPYLLPLF